MTDAFSEAPLSDLMAVFAADETPESFAAFVSAFRTSIVGVIAEGASPGTSGRVTSTAAHPISLAHSDHGDGQERLLAFADPVAFVRRFGQPFNAEMTGEALMVTAMSNELCAGILVNSAISESSVTIGRATIESQIGRRPWWRLW